MTETRIMVFVLVLCVMALVLLGCSSTRYTGDTGYYWERGTLYSCREPEPFKGGNCMVDREWPDGGLSR